ncbi:hypothetical protein RHGRI_001638 [Rhododendron griersonianum]|uniref:Uncharacterized protein n=1 Tax=Rhododendron griersonianum TaxID=479676 RepID=A0AAV6LKU6_9ERIC|nr:hypothetical protein RHGRI_001638 [Rhododendron griersonianum]
MQSDTPFSSIPIELGNSRSNATAEFNRPSSSTGQGIQSEEEGSDSEEDLMEVLQGVVSSTIEADSLIQQPRPAVPLGVSTIHPVTSADPVTVPDPATVPDTATTVQAFYTHGNIKLGELDSAITSILTEHREVQLPQSAAVLFFCCVVFSMEYSCCVVRAQRAQRGVVVQFMVSEMAVMLFCMLLFLHAALLFM